MEQFGGAIMRAAGPADLPALLALVQGANLPAAGVADCLDGFLVAESAGAAAAAGAGALVGAAGLEVYGAHALLRSVVVHPDWRSRGVGAALTEALLARAAASGLDAVYLLTDTAENYFPRLGFERIPREQVPAAVQQSLEFRELCPASSVVMVKRLAPGEPRP